MRFAIKHCESVDKLILNGGNLNAKGVKGTTQIPIEIGYKIAKHFAKKSIEANKNAEILGLMVNEPNISIEELNTINNKTLVIAGTRDMIKKKHTMLIAQSIKNSKLVFIKGNHFIANKKPHLFNDEVKKFLLNS